MKGKGKEVERGNIRSRVLHLQAPDVKTTSIRWGALTRGDEGLGISLPFVHLAVKDLGQLFYFDLGVLDERGQLLMIRASTWQVRRARSRPFSLRQLTMHLRRARQKSIHRLMPTLHFFTCLFSSLRPPLISSRRGRPSPSPFLSSSPPAQASVNLLSHASPHYNTWRSTPTAD